MITFTNNMPHRNMRQLAYMRGQARELEAGGVKTTALQLLRYGVCPCIAMGSYSRCCAVLHGDLSK